MPTMRFIATLNDKQHVIVVGNHGRDDGCYTMSLDCRPCDVDAQLMKSHLVSVLIVNHSYDVDVEKMSEEPGTVSAIRVKEGDAVEAGAILLIIE